MMSDDRKRQPDDPEDDTFADALDDLFGHEEQETRTVSPVSANPNSNPAPQRQARQESYTSPVSQANPEPGRRPESEHNANPLPSYSQTQTSAPQQVAGRSIARVAGIGCAAVVGITVLCLIILMIIGLVAGDGTDGSTGMNSVNVVMLGASVSVGGYAF